MSEDEKQKVGDQFDSFELLSDKPIDNDEEIEFGHDEIAKSIFSVIKKAATPFTIGLYGKWGLGKTTIAKSVKKLADQNNFKVFYFDVWKYERDSFRRQFLIELDNELKLDFDFKKTLNQSLSESDPLKGKIGFDYRVVFNQLGILFLVLLVIGVISFFIDKETLKIKDLLSNILLTSGLLGTIYNLMFNAIQRTQLNITNPRTDSAEGFEDFFKKALNQIKIKYNDAKLLVIIDNLDRVEDKKAIDMLSDIKTFLSCDKKNKDENNNVVFLIPCDNAAIRDQILSIYGKQFDADEFLRKFFNLTFYIPKLINLDLDRYIRKQLAQTEIKEFQDNKGLEDVIIFTFRDNPREIKQFINSLISAFVLAKNRRLDDVIKNISFLAKILALRQKFSILYYALEERSLRSVVNFENDGGIEKLYRGELEKLGYSEVSMTDEQIRFRNWNQMTKGYNINNLDIYFSLKQSDEEKKIPEWTSYVLSAEEGREEEAKKIYEEIIKNNKFDDFDGLLKDYVVKRKSGAGLLKLTSITVKISAAVNNKLPQFFNISSHYFPMGNELNKYLDDFDPKVVFNFWYPNIQDKANKKNLVNQHITLLRVTTGSNTSGLPVEYANKLLSEISNNVKIFSFAKNEIRSLIEDNLFRYMYIKNIDSKDSQKEFFTDVAKKKFIESINLEYYKDQQEFEAMIEYFNRLDIPDFETINIIEKYNQLLSNTNNSDPRRLMIVKSLAIFIKKKKTIVESLDNELKIKVESLCDRLPHIYDESGEELRDELIGVIDFLSQLVTNKVNDLKSRLQNYIQSSNADSITKQTKSKLISWSKRFPDAITNRGVNDAQFIIQNNLQNYLSNAQHYRIIEQLVNRDLVSTYDYLNKINNNIASPKTIIDKIVDRIINQSKTVEVQDLKALSDLNLDNYDNPRNKLYNYMQNIMNRSSTEKTKIRKISKDYLGLFTVDQQKELKLGSRKKN
ncbi:MAG: P-loop NTPase fold protein [Candidatus Pacebacteria bacterium]|nr:P-loop NTPase fold protein [Candidatus Paceibacterota bacterium]